MIERIEGRLDSWKAIILSKGVKLTIIKATLVSIPNYYLTLFTILVSMANCVERNLGIFCVMIPFF